MSIEYLDSGLSSMYVTKTSFGNANISIAWIGDETRVANHEDEGISFNLDADDAAILVGQLQRIFKFPQCPSNVSFAELNAASRTPSIRE